MPTGAKLRLLGQFLRARDERFAPRHLAGEGSVDRRGGFDKGGLVSLIDLYPAARTFSTNSPSAVSPWFSDQS